MMDTIITPHVFIDTFPFWKSYLTTYEIASKTSVRVMKIAQNVKK